MISSIRKLINGLKKDREHGAGWLTAQGMNILQTASRDSLAHTMEKYVAELGQVAGALMEARPGMVSIANYAMQFKEEIEDAAANPRSLENLKKQAVAIAKKHIRAIEAGSIKTTRNAYKLITQRNIIMTCSYSSSVLTTLDLARSKGIDFKVLALESRSGKISYGEMLAGHMQKSGIPCRVIPDDQLRWHVARANIILIGVDTVSLHGWLINGQPSLQLAEVAGRKKVPLYAIGELAKFDVRGWLAGMRAAEPGFNMVPLDLITGIVTEKGILKPDEIYRITLDDIFGSWHARAD